VPFAFSSAMRSSIRRMSNVEFEVESVGTLPSSLERARARARTMLLNQGVDLLGVLMVFLTFG